MELPSNVTAAGDRPTAFSASITRVWVLLSTLTVAFADDTCTAGASPKKFGSV